jgi:hypothetical protein
VTASAGSLVVKHLADAHCPTLMVEGGAAALTLDFGGRLTSAMTGSIAADMARLAVTTPSTTPTTIAADIALGRLTHDAGFTKRDGGYWTPAALRGGWPGIALHIQARLATLSLLLTPAA